MIDLSIIIVSYNTKEFLKECLISIFNNKENLNIEIIVIDNASSDGSVDLIKKEFPKTILIQNKKNLGFAKANNLGIKKAKGKYVLFLNSDTVLRSNVLETIFEFMEKHSKVGATTCKVELLDGQLDDACHRGFPTPWNAFCHFSGLAKLPLFKKIFRGYSLGWADLGKIHEIDACAGAFMFVRKTTGQEIKWWDEDYFWYGEDLDFCFKLKAKDWKIYFIPTVSILHYKGVSGGIKDASRDLTTADQETKKMAKKARFDAMRIFYKKHYLKKYPKIITWLVLKGINFKEKLTSV